MDEIKVSVIMSTYNEATKWLTQAIDSILNQSYTNIEFIIILDNPQNAEIESLINTYKAKYAQIKFVKNIENIGLAKSLNKALEYCTGEYIARMDADDIASIDRIQKQVRYMKAHNVDILGGAIQLIDEEEGIITNRVGMPLDNHSINKKINSTNCLAHPTWMVKAEVYQLLAGYRDIHACEDYDFLLRAINKGYKLGNLSEVLLQYRMTKNSISRKNALKQYLTMQYLSKNRSRIDSISNREINEFVDVKITENKAHNYSKANQKFVEAAAQIEQKNYLAAVINIVGALTISKEFTRKIIYMVVTLLSKK